MFSEQYKEPFKQSVQYDRFPTSLCFQQMTYSMDDDCTVAFSVQYLVRLCLLPIYVCFKIIILHVPVVHSVVGPNSVSEFTSKTLICTTQFVWRRRLWYRHYPIVRVVVVVATKWFCVQSVETVRDRPIITTGRNYNLTVAIILYTNGKSISAFQNPQKMWPRITL